MTTIKYIKYVKIDFTSLVLERNTFLLHTQKVRFFLCTSVYSRINAVLKLCRKRQDGQADLQSVRHHPMNNRKAAGM